VRDAGELAAQAFSRAAGVPLLGGNRVRLLRDARENYPAWLAAIAAARSHVHLECYILAEDATGARFAEALLAAARAGVRVRVLYDWLGCLGRASRRFWRRLRGGGVEVRCYNPPRLDSPLGWLSRDHRKLLAVDAEVAFVTGLCIARAWEGDAARGREPWRDTGVELRGPAVAEVERAFAAAWEAVGAPLAAGELPVAGAPAPAGDTSVRIVASLPATAGMFRLDQLIAALARERLWLTDAYYAGMAPYVQALRAAAGDGVDVRLLVPGATDLALLKQLSRAGYRTLLQAGVRVFEWNGAMLHAKTAVADSRWARVGSTNLNLASWLGNCELDAVVEDEAFAREMEAMFLDDLANATELVLDARQKVRPTLPPHPEAGAGRSGGSFPRVAAGAVRIGNVVGAAITRRRVLEPVEARLTASAGALFLLLAVLTALFPAAVAYPLAAVLAWLGVVLALGGARLFRAGRRARRRTRAG